MLWILIGLWLQPVPAGYAQDYNAEIGAKAFSDVKKQAEKMEVMDLSELAFSQGKLRFRVEAKKIVAVGKGCFIYYYDQFGLQKNMFDFSVTPSLIKPMRNERIWILAAVAKNEFYIFRETKNLSKAYWA